jgi:hypothetical protein
MSIRKLAMVAALGLSMASAPVFAQTGASRSGPEMMQASGQDNPPRGQGRGRGPVDGDEGAFAGGTTTYIIAFFVIIVIALGIYFALDKDDDGRTSP